MFPMYVGMNRVGLSGSWLEQHVPHVCGDEPYKVIEHTDLPECSPCMWG